MGLNQIKNGLVLKNGLRELDSHIINDSKTDFLKVVLYLQ